MEVTKNKMPPFANNFFNRLSYYLDKKIYFYGSIQRNDYFPESSDIDVDIFTDNVTSTLHQIQAFLQVNKYDFKKFVYRLHKSNTVASGYKIKYSDAENKFSTEISIYNEKYKDVILKEHNYKTYLPFYISFLLIILKTLYYNVCIIPKPLYKFCKKIIMNYMLEGEDVEFIIVEIPKHKND